MGVWSRLVKLAGKAEHEADALAHQAARVEPGAVEEGIKSAAKSDKPKVTLAEVQQAKTDRIAAEALERQRDAGKVLSIEKLNDLTPGRFGRDQLDSRLKALNETAKEHGLIDASLVREKGKVLSPKQAEEALRTGKPITPNEMTGLQNGKQADFEKWAKKDAANNKPVAAGSGMANWQKYGIIGTVLTATLGFVGNAITGDDPNDPADNNLTHIQRVKYKYKKAFSDEGNKQIDMAVNATTENSRQNLAEAQRGEQVTKLNQNATAALAGMGKTAVNLGNSGTPSNSSPYLVGKFEQAVKENSSGIEESKLHVFSANFATIGTKLGVGQDGKLDGKDQLKLANSKEFSTLIDDLPLATKEKTKILIALLPAPAVAR